MPVISRPWNTSKKLQRFQDLKHGADKIRWIDTSTMICDPLTKAGPKGFADRLIACMTTGVLDLEPTVESQMKKLQQQKRNKGPGAPKDKY